jgi:hypothetical protein
MASINSCVDSYEAKMARRRFDDDDEYDDKAPVRREQDISDDPGIRMLLPVGRSGWAIASGYLGLFSLLLIPGPIAILTGILAIVEMSRNPKKHGMGRAVFGIVMGTLGTIGLILIVIVSISAALKRR